MFNLMGSSRRLGLGEETMNRTIITMTTTLVLLAACSSDSRPDGVPSGDGNDPSSEGQSAAGDSPTPAQQSGGAGGTKTSDSSGDDDSGSTAGVTAGAGTGGSGAGGETDTGSNSMCTSSEPVLDAPVIVCSCAEVSWNDNPAIVSTVTGDNGTFTNTCTDAGNLTQYNCEFIKVDPTCDESGLNPLPCDRIGSGRVSSKKIDCGGRCQSGTCPTRCAEAGDGITVLARNGDSVTLQNALDPRPFDCKLRLRQPVDTSNCDAVIAGDEGAIVTVSVTVGNPGASFCVTGFWGYIEVNFTRDGADNCNFGCGFDCVLGACGA